MKISTLGTPYIQLESGRFIFSRSTSDSVKGYKYLCYVGVDSKTVCISGSRAKYKRYSDVSEDVNFTVRLRDFRRDDKKAFPKKKIKGQISDISLNWMKKLIMGHLNDEYVPFRAIPDIMTQINFEDETDTFDEDPTVDDFDEDDFEDIEPEVKRPLSKTVGIGKKGRKLKVKVKPNFKVKLKGKK